MQEMESLIRGGVIGAAAATGSSFMAMGSIINGDGDGDGAGMMIIR
jgi:hypothetical protein